MKIYLFDKDYANQYKSYWSTFRYGLTLTLIILFMSFFYGFVLAYFEDSFSDVILTLLGIGFLVLYIPIIVFASFYGELFYLSSKTGYVLDEWNVLWQVQFIQKNHFKPIPCTKDNLKEYFLRYREGESFYHPLFGGDCKITRLEQIECIKNKKKYGIYSYINEKGKRKSIYIPHAYPEFAKRYLPYSWY